MSTGVPVVAGLNPALAPHIQATFVHNILKLYSRLEEVDTEIDAMVSFFKSNWTWSVWWRYGFIRIFTPAILIFLSSVGVGGFNPAGSIF